MITKAAGILASPSIHNSSMFRYGERRYTRDILYEVEISLQIVGFLYPPIAPRRSNIYQCMYVGMVVHFWMVALLA